MFEYSREKKIKQMKMKMIRNYQTKKSRTYTRNERNSNEQKNT